MIFFVTVPMFIFFSCLVYSLWLASDIETHWQDPPYDWNFEDEDLWLEKPAPLDYQSRED
jgi:hypothetical protein